MKILVIDDREENIQSAKQLIDRLNSEKSISWRTELGRYEITIPKKEKIYAVYANDVKSALDEISKNEFKAVLLDAYLHYDGGETPLEIREEIAEILAPYGVLSDEKLSNTSKKQKNKIHRGVKRWLKESKTPPTGVLLAQRVLDKNTSTSIVFNTSAYHLSHLGQPVARWAWNRNIRFIDCDGVRLARKIEAEAGEDGLDGYSVISHKNINDVVKDWRRALHTIL